MAEEKKSVKAEGEKKETVKKTAAKKATTAPIKKETVKTAAKKPAAVKTEKAEAVKAEDKSPVKKAEKPVVKKAEKLIKITLVKSTTGNKKDQIATCEALGLKKIRQYNILKDNAAIRGMIYKVRHLVTVSEVIAEA